MINEDGEWVQPDPSRIKALIWPDVPRRLQGRFNSTSSAWRVVDPSSQSASAFKPPVPCRHAVLMSGPLTCAL